MSLAPKDTYMKKLLTLLLVALLSLALVACGTNCTEHIDENGDKICDICGADTSNEGGKGDTGADLVLVEDYVTLFKVVCAISLSDVAENYVYDLISELNNKNLDDRGLKTNYDARGYDDDVEIIFGSPSYRGDAYIKDVHDLGYTGFSVELIGNKLLVLAGGDEGYKNAIDYLKSEIFKLNGYESGVIDSLVIPGGTRFVQYASGFPIHEITIGGISITDYVLSYQWNSGPAKEAARIFKQHVYENFGLWMNEVDPAELADGQRAIHFEITRGDPSRYTDNGYSIYVRDNDLYVECEFDDKILHVVADFVKSTFDQQTVSIANDFVYTVAARDVYYAEFGAVGDGVTDDFFAIKACHDYANLYGHTVHADGPDKTYYIGNYLSDNDKSTSIIINTDTNWHGCTFIFDDSKVGPGTPCYSSSIFLIKPTRTASAYSTSQITVSSLTKGATTLGGWAPGVDCLVYIENNKERHYIRYGLNANNGSAQHEILYVHADGTIDPSTPLQWDYETISDISFYPCDSKPITVSGGDGDQRVNIKTIFNGAPSRYTYYQRNLKITRSNVTLKNINHLMEGEIPESQGGTGAPYGGFTQVAYAHNVTIENLLIHNLKGYHLETNKSNGMGTYELSANHSNNVLWKNVTQDVFFDADGGVSYQGLMGTNYCKNLTFDGNFVCSFDAHCGVYNGTIKNSTIEHLNFIGDGLITIENCTLYLDGSRTAIQLRSDYGATWRGDVYMKDVDLKYEMKTKNRYNFSLISSTWNNHYFGYTCYLPQNIYVENVNMLGFSVTVKDGVREETIEEVNNKKIYLFTYNTVYNYTSVDISDPDALISSKKNDWKKCSCGAFNDTDGDGRCNNTVKGPSGQSVWCWGFEEQPNTLVNANPYIGTKSVTVVNGDTENPLEIVWPTTPQFKDLNVTVDGDVVIKNGKKV